MRSRIAFLGVFLGISILVGLVEAIVLGFAFVETTTMSWTSWLDGATFLGLSATGTMIGGATIPILAVMFRARFRTVVVLGFVVVLLAFMGSELPDLTVDQLPVVASGSKGALSLEIGRALSGVLNGSLGVVIAIYVAHRMRCFSPRE